MCLEHRTRDKGREKDECGERGTGLTPGGHGEQSGFHSPCGRQHPSILSSQVT